MGRVEKKEVAVIEEIISRISREKQGYCVELQSGDSFSVSEDALVKFRLLKGMTVERETLEAAVRASQVDGGYQLALNYLSYQLRSQQEMETYLRGKEILPEWLPQIIQRLKELQLIDDLVYAESDVRTQARLSDKGPQVIRQQLKKRGISEELIEQALVHYPADDQLEVAIATATKALRKYARSSHQEQLQKVRQFLMTKGFAGDIITAAMAELQVEKDEDEELTALREQGERLWRRHQRLDQRKRREKVSQGLYRKGFSFDLINAFISEKELADE